jgi:SurA N-terminal domain
MLRFHVNIAIAVGTLQISSGLAAQPLSPPGKIYSAAAFVNGHPITETDVSQRLALIAIFNDKALSGEDTNRLRAVILRNLVDERLQIQTARAERIVVSRVDVDGVFDRLARDRHQTREGFASFLANQGSSRRSLALQIESDLAWHRLTNAKFGPTQDSEPLITSEDPLDTIVWLKQIAIAFPKGVTPADAQKLTQKFGQIVNTIASCETVTSIATLFQADIVEKDDVRMGDVPPELRAMLVDRPVGTATPPFGSIAEGMRTLVLCGRSLPAPGPNPKAVARWEHSTANYLRSLRKDSVIEFRDAVTPPG